MPRGIYDRSKSKEQRAAEKADGKPSNPKATKKYSKKGAPAAVSFISSAGFHSLDENHKRLEALEQYFAILTTAKAQNGLSTGLTAKLDSTIHNTIERMEALANRIWPLDSKSEIGEATQSKKNGSHAHAAQAAPTAQVAPVAPVPFNPAAPATQS
jgi:hypothetical protein